MATGDGGIAGGPGPSGTYGEKLQKTIDDVNNLFGKDTLSQAVYMPTNDKLYEIGQKSPGYTTNINEIITLKAD